MRLPLLSALLALAPLTSAAAPRPRADTTATAARALDRFGFDLYARLRPSGGNLFYSPLSLGLALGMAQEGASGETGRQMRAVLHLTPALQRSLPALARGLEGEGRAGVLDVANALWGQTGLAFRRAFTDALQTRYHATLERVNFRDPGAAAAAINHWVDGRTHGRIPTLVAPGQLPARTGLVLTNAVYFKAAWKTPFPEGSADAAFTLAPGRTASVPFMVRRGSYRYAEDALVQVLELPYEGDAATMLIVLPRHARDLPAIERNVLARRLPAWTDRLASRQVEVHLPKFQLATQASLAPLLKAMGMVDAFDPRRADFSGMDGRRDLFVSAVLHKAYVKVDERGTEAAAATGVVMSVTSVMGGSPVVFRADHPFVFAIRDARTHALLFIGRLVDPRG